MIGVVLAGGAGKRMGQDKAEVVVADRPMIAWVIAALEPVVDRVIISGRTGGWHGHGGLADLEEVAGPLAGLAASLRLGEPVLLVAVDQPWVRTGTLAELASIRETVVPVHGEVRQVTCAVYYPVILDSVSQAGSLQGLLDAAAPLEVTEPVWRSWGEDGRSWFSVDRPEDVAVGLERYGVPG
ncbi:MAG TPA: molybdenum cofactor guanylyltransferase [Acidimicrobiia bacterium]|nr:molybdenum cofactor guanylyltransferase [Acidimicrobiia bacterium]